MEKCRKDMQEAAGEEQKNRRDQSVISDGDFGGLATFDLVQQLL